MDRSRIATWLDSRPVSKKGKRYCWRTGDRVRILEGSFMDTSCTIHEIDEANQIVVVGFGSSTLVEVSMKDLERHFFVGDQVRVAFGTNKGKTGSIVKITDDVGTIVEGAAKLIEVSPPSIRLHLFIILPSSKCYCHIFGTGI